MCEEWATNGRALTGARDPRRTRPHRAVQTARSANAHHPHHHRRDNRSSYRRRPRGPRRRRPRRRADHGWYAGESTIKGSQRSSPATANVYVPPAELFAGNATVRAAGPPAWPANPKPIARPRAVVTAPASGLDWGSAGIGGAAVLGAFAITLAGIVGLRRRRTARPRPLITR